MSRKTNVDKEYAKWCKEIEGEVWLKKKFQIKKKTLVLTSLK